MKLRNITVEFEVTEILAPLTSAPFLKQGMLGM